MLFNIEYYQEQHPKHFKGNDPTKNGSSYNIIPLWQSCQESNKENIWIQ